VTAKVRTFESGATRDLDVDKYDYDGFLSPIALEAFAAYMHKHRLLPDGTLRASDNWKQGIPLEAYAKSEWRHHMDFWKLHHGLPAREDMVDTLCALWFNVQGYLHEYLKAQAAEVEAIKAWPAREVWVSREEAEAMFPSATVVARVPPYAERDADDPMGLTAGQAIKPGLTD
jgi:hypothetical protein